MRVFAGFAPIAERYEGFILDLWGVIHDGVNPYPGLEGLRGRPVLLLSNAPRRAYAAQKMLQRMGIPDDAYGSILTSGEACYSALLERSDPWFAGLGHKVFFLGPVRDRNLIEGIDLVEVREPSAADFVINTGPDDERDPTDLGAFAEILAECFVAGLPMLCANPDLEVIRGGHRILCAGSLAAEYARLGGEVKTLGKPDVAIYQRAFTMLGVDPARVVAVGDSLRTDITGARNAGIDAVMIAHGVDAPVLGDIYDAGASERLDRVTAGLPVLGVMPRFCW